MYIHIYYNRSLLLFFIIFAMSCFNFLPFHFRGILVHLCTIVISLVVGTAWKMPGGKCPRSGIISIKSDRSILKASLYWVSLVLSRGYKLNMNTIRLLSLPGYSQGGLLARAAIQSLPNHNVKTFISLSSPQAGQYGSKLAPHKHIVVFL